MVLLNCGTPEADLNRLSELVDGFCAMLSRCCDGLYRWWLDWAGGSGSGINQWREKSVCQRSV